MPTSPIVTQHPPPTASPPACRRCGDAGEVVKPHMALLRGRGANFYRHGRYAASVQIIGPAVTPTRACPDCTGYAALFGLTRPAWTCRHCGTTYDALALAATGAGCACLVDRVNAAYLDDLALAAARQSDRRRRAL